MLTAVDGFSKRIWAVPMRDKTQESVIEALTALSTPAANFRFRIFFTANDKSFLAQKTQEWLLERSIAHICSATRLHCFLAERSIQTLGQKLCRLLYYRRDFDWSTPLAQTVKSYNNTPHTLLVNGKYTPNQVTVYNAPEIYNYMYHGGGERTRVRGHEKEETTKGGLAVGDTVLIARPIAPTRAGQIKTVYVL